MVLPRWCSTCKDFAAVHEEEQDDRYQDVCTKCNTALLFNSIELVKPEPAKPEDFKGYPQMEMIDDVPPMFQSQAHMDAFYALANNHERDSAKSVAFIDFKRTEKEGYSVPALMYHAPSGRQCIIVDGVEKTAHDMVTKKGLKYLLGNINGDILSRSGKVYLRYMVTDRAISVLYTELSK